MIESRLLPKETTRRALKKTNRMSFFDDLPFWHAVLIFLIFIWSGFVRSGLGFGGAVLSLPFLLLVHDQPLIFLPLVSVHLLVFSSLTIAQPIVVAGIEAGDWRLDTNIDWLYLRKILAITIVPKLLGVFGVISLPSHVITNFIFVIVLIYGISYLLNRQFVSNHPTLDLIFLLLGGYISGTSLIGAPLIIAVMARHLPREKLRDTLFALWFILVSIKLAAFAAAGIDLQWWAHLWLLPAAGIGHILGLKFHRYSLQVEPKRFMQFIGAALIFVALAGLWQTSVAAS